MVMFLEYLPQEPSDPVYGKILTGSAAYEWEAQAQYRVRRIACILKRMPGSTAQTEHLSCRLPQMHLT